MKTIKRLFAYGAILAMTLFYVSANAQRVTDIEYRQVPMKSQNFIKNLLPGQVPEHAFISRVTLSPTYNVVMRGRTEFIFDKKGEWIEVNGHGNGLPMTMLPKASQDYIMNEYGNIGILSVMRAEGNYVVMIAEGDELKFDKTGKSLNPIDMNSEDMMRKTK